MKRLLAALAVLVVGSLAGCSAHSPETQLARCAQEIRSWAADSRLVAQRWEARMVPTAYALDTLEAAQEEVRQQLQSAASIDGADEAKRAKVRDLGSRVISVCGRLTADVQRSEGRDAAATAERLVTIETQLRELMGPGQS